ncbi:hypothetical protein RRG08_051301 [Elysia crispata]|uniref:Uncharacterized protein n=1 Tax=Elysia crispata TaxID=231223 RepID=A0AAE1CLF9_9GAST|nr:hypothetical protein RRG08_051301 [Elysia crispata]
MEKAISRAQAEEQTPQLHDMVKSPRSKAVEVVEPVLEVKKRNKVLHITQNDDDSGDEETQKFWVGALEKSEGANCWFAHVQVQGESLKMKIETGAETKYATRENMDDNEKPTNFAEVQGGIESF